MENMESMSNEEGRTDQFPVGMRVLAVDDNPTCLRKLEELLLRCKYHGTSDSLLLSFFFFLSVFAYGHDRIIVRCLVDLI